MGTGGVSSPAPAGGPLSWIDWAAAGRALPGEAESGDAHVVIASENRALVALVDGLGHGAGAAFAARQAISAVRAHASEPLEALVEHCHEALRKTRGVVLTVAAIHPADDTLSWLGVGNVEALLLRANPAMRRESALLRGGVVGDQLPPLRASSVGLALGDTMVLATDGVRSDFTAGLDARGEPREIADRILDRHARSEDDALVVVVRYRGQRP